MALTALLSNGLVKRKVGGVAERQWNPTWLKVLDLATVENSAVSLANSAVDTLRKIGELSTLLGSWGPEWLFDGIVVVKFFQPRIAVAESPADQDNDVSEQMKGQKDFGFEVFHQIISPTRHPVTIAVIRPPTREASTPPRAAPHA